MHVALVDQSLTTQGTICDLLKGRGHTVYSFTNSRRALDRIRADAEIDGVIVDAEVGPISSAELCWETRLLAGKQRAIYVLLMSSSPDEQLLIGGLDCGADDFIVKPPRSGELCAKLRVAERVVTVQRELIRLATRDPLTGSHNRRAFFEEAMQACCDVTAGLSVILVDIDHFKAINDRYGHDVGDQASAECRPRGAKGWRAGWTVGWR